MATDLTAWAPEIEPSIIGIPQPALILAVRNACIRFCEKTYLWKYTLDRVTTVINTSEYTLTIPDAQHADMIIVDNVYYKEDGEDDDQFSRLAAISEVKWDDTNSAWQFETDDAPTRFWVDLVELKLHLYPIPTAASTEGLLIKVILKPEDDCTTVPDFLRRDYRDVIADGALADLFGRKRTPWYDPNEQARHNFDFKQGCDNAKLKRIQGATRLPLTAQVPFFC